MTTELYYLTLTCALTASQWMPYILNQLAVRGLVRAMGNPLPNDPPLSNWADRAKRAHQNSTENLVVFGILVMIAHITNANSDLTAKAAAVYFFARIIHYIIFLVGVPFLRTILFVISWLSTMVFAVAILTH